MKCPNCGAEANGNFCMYCGATLKRDTPQSMPDAIYRIRELEINREREIEQAKKAEREEQEKKRQETKKKQLFVRLGYNALIFGSIVLFFITWSYFFIVTFIIGLILRHNLKNYPFS